MFRNGFARLGSLGSELMGVLLCGVLRTVMAVADCKGCLGKVRYCTAVEERGVIK